MIYAIYNPHNLSSLLELPEGVDLHQLQEEFAALNQAGPNPKAYDTYKQYEWLKKKHEEEDRLAKLYGGTIGGTDGTRLFLSTETFIGWLVSEKDAQRVQYKSFTFNKFD